MGYLTVLCYVALISFVFYVWSPKNKNSAHSLIRWMTNRSEVWKTAGLVIHSLQRWPFKKQQ